MTACHRAAVLKYGQDIPFKTDFPDFYTGAEGFKAVPKRGLNAGPETSALVAHNEQVLRRYITSLGFSWAKHVYHGNIEPLRLLGLKRAPEFEAWLQRMGVTGADGRLLPAAAQTALAQRLWALPEPA